MSLRTEQSSSAFFDDLSYATRYAAIEFLFAIASRSEAEIGWTEGIIHEMKSTQKGTEIILVHPSSPMPPSSSGSKLPDTNKADEVLGVFINCTKFSRFVFTINQHIKISLKGARIIRELGPFESGFSLVFSGDVAIQYLSGGVCVPDGTVIDTRQGCDYQSACPCLEFPTSRQSLDNPGVTPPRTPPRKSSPRHTWPPFLGQTSAPSHNKGINIRHDYNDIKTYPPLNSLTEGMETPLLGMVESIKTPSTTSTGGLCVNLVLADVSSYRAKRGFHVTCFTSKSSLARDLPTPSPGDVILFKSVNIERWARGISGTVCESKLDWIVYDRNLDRVVPAGHAVSDIMIGHDLEGFYTDVLARKGLFKQFIAAMWRCYMNEWGFARGYSFLSKTDFPSGKMFF